MHCALYFYYGYSSSTSDHQALDPRGWGPLLKGWTRNPKVRGGRAVSQDQPPAGREPGIPILGGRQHRLGRRKLPPSLLSIPRAPKGNLGITGWHFQVLQLLVWQTKATTWCLSSVWLGCAWSWVCAGKQPEGRPNRQKVLKGLRLWVDPSESLFELEPRQQLYWSQKLPGRYLGGVGKRTDLRERGKGMGGMV